MAIVESTSQVSDDGGDHAFSVCLSVCVSVSLSLSLRETRLVARKGRTGVLSPREQTMMTDKDSLLAPKNRRSDVL